MDPRISDQLEKVLALADSAHESEALVAVRKARQMLSRDGLSFADLARNALSRPRASRGFSLFSGAQMNLEVQLAQLRQKLDDLQAEIESRDVQIEFWRCRSAEIEQALQLAQVQAERWRQLARDTVEKLWDLGEGAEAGDLAAGGLGIAEQKSA